MFQSTEDFFDDTDMEDSMSDWSSQHSGDEA